MQIDLGLAVSLELRALRHNMSIGGIGNSSHVLHIMIRRRPHELRDRLWDALVCHLLPGITKWN